ncbi:hypothetical protein AVEN_94110-1 [Araneus ventricosus]|uniref:Uncharacterized protein n=1 Tax=Araneus ventricosus TaxID=182803 RepID=A0A4Y2MT15_ARAVE|nr:hypothetical protein AVEN_94110-1 [Araneus ventricosus]
MEQGVKHHVERVNITKNAWHTQGGGLATLDPDSIRVAFSYGVALNRSYMRRLWTYRRISKRGLSSLRQTSKAHLASSSASRNRSYVVVVCAVTSEAATDNNSCNNSSNKSFCSYYCTFVVLVSGERCVVLGCPGSSSRFNLSIS